MYYLFYYYFLFVVCLICPIFANEGVIYVPFYI